ANAVDEYAHVDAALDCARQAVDETPADVVRLQNVRAQVDEGFGALDGFEHGRVGFFAIAQRCHRVAGYQRPGGQPVAGGGQTVQRRRHHVAVIADVTGI